MKIRLRGRLSKPAAAEGCLDPDALKYAGEQNNKQLIQSLRSALADADASLTQKFHNNEDVNQLVKARAWVVDQLIIHAWNSLIPVEENISLVAVGGFGRGELHPHSDVDLLILLAEPSPGEELRSAIEAFVTLLWDAGFYLGHSVRTVEACVSEAKKDITTATSLMESRLLSGRTEMMAEMLDATAADQVWSAAEFFDAKFAEQVKRHEQYHDTAYNLEPNIKEGPGGLRDIQMIGWVAKRHFNADSLHDLVDKNFLLEDELNTLLEGQHLLWRIRCSLHYLAGRREDRLLFDYQRDLAIEFGFKDNDVDPKNEAIEQFMQQYYRTVIELERLNEMLLQHFREAIIYADVNEDAALINDHFQVRNGYLETTSKTVFKDNPYTILEMFTVLQNYPDIQGVRAETIREIREYRELIDEDFRQSPRAHQLFVKIINGSRGVTHELKRMNRYGILAAYIPAFESIVGRMQYDLFHAYTVDQHTLFVIRNMRRLSVPDYCHEFPLASGVFQHLSKPSLLYLSGLFHDIAKGRQGDHATLGAVDAKDFCDLHGLPEADSELVSWLVENHLVMSMTAQRKDINDPDIIDDFARQIKTLQRLDYLYLLTISDIRGTNPKQWSDWKDKLLGELYNKTAALLNKGLKVNTADQKSNKEMNIAVRQTASLRRLETKGINSHQTNELWDTLNADYFQSHTYGQIAWHTALIIDAKQKGTLNSPLIKTRIHQSSNSIQLLIYMKDREHIFYDAVSTLSNNEVDIVNAHIVNTSDGFALETFRLTPVNVNSSEMEIIAEQINLRLRDKLNSTSEATQTLLSGSRKLKYFSTPTIARFKRAEDN
ncbi:MAG: [protein-PII] uridylyltransferase, partial [Gammaproteobacteria bacterium]|nr:[protein-PII] uridylyltransferase [Gammaproteobacteria bacterium]